MIHVNHLRKVYPVALKEPGLGGTLRHFFQRSYRYVEAVKDISFQIDSGEIVGFLGANGAGKTTTLKMLTGLIYPSSGEISVAGYTPSRRESGFLNEITLVMGQKQQLIWDLPALDSLRINAAVYGISDVEFRKRLDELADLLDLQAKLRQPVRKLSLGERMKAELLAALIHHPKVLFLDEPTLGLDVNAQVSVRRFLQEYNRRYEATILLTSHYMADITALCQRVLVIHEGSLVYDGDLEQLIERFAPYREIKLDLSQTYSAKILSQYGELCEEEGSTLQTARLMVDRQHLTRTISQILADLEVVDLTVTDPPVEEVIGRVFHAGWASQAEPRISSS